MDRGVRRAENCAGAPSTLRPRGTSCEVEALIAACNGGDGTQRVPALIVLADIDTLRSGLHANSICETDDGTPLPVEVVRRLACDAEIIPVVLNSKRRSARRRTRRNGWRHPPNAPR